MTNWISIKDKKPLHNQKVLATDEERIEILSYCSSCDILEKPYPPHKGWKVATYWMPLPEMPHD